MGNFEKRREALNKIICTLRKIDKYNLENEDAFLLDKDALIREVCTEYLVKKETSEKWVAEAIEIATFSHELVLAEEWKVRKNRDGI